MRHKLFKIHDADILVQVQVIHQLLNILLILIASLMELPMELMIGPEKCQTQWGWIKILLQMIVFLVHANLSTHAFNNAMNIGDVIMSISLTVSDKPVMMIIWKKIRPLVLHFQMTIHMTL